MSSLTSVRRRAAWPSCSAKFVDSRHCRFFATAAAQGTVAAVRGMHDHFAEEAAARHLAAQCFSDITRRRGYSSVETPSVEQASVFLRGLGEGSDVVMKEIYSFPSPKRADSGSDTDLLLALRPEGTAGIMRALIQSGRLRQGAQKLSYCGSMFRHERPQKGRYRQFTQLGIENVGSKSHLADVEVIQMADSFLRSVLPIAAASPAASPSDGASHLQQAVPPTAAAAAGAGPGLQLKLLVNTLGDDLRAYTAYLTEFFTKHQSSLSPDSVARLQRGAVLRILDSKSGADQALITEVKPIQAFLPEAALARFDAVLSGLRSVGIDYTIEPRLVRGLDYYCHTVFEFTCTTAAAPVTGTGTAPTSAPPAGPSTEQTGGSAGRAALPPAGVGQLGTVLAGGRYDRLSTMLGHPDAVPCIGWAAGMERLCLLGDQHLRSKLAVQSPQRVAVLPVTFAKPTADQAAAVTAIEHACLRIADAAANRASMLQYVHPPNVEVHLLDPVSKIGKGLTTASSLGCSIVYLVGEDEVRDGVVTVKNLDSGTQDKEKMSDIVGSLNRL